MYAENFKIDVLLFWEHRDREVEVIVEIAKKLKHDYGLSVAVASTVYDRFFSLFFVRPKVVVFHSNKSLPPLFYSFYGEKIKYACMNWEQMLSVFNKTAAKKADDYLNKSLMKNFAWGKNFCDFLIETGVPAENIILTGRPSLTILREKAANQSTIRQQIADRYNLDQKRPWLFFPLTCLHAFFDDRVVFNFAQNKLISNQVDYKLALARRDYVRRTVHTIFNWIDNISSAAAVSCHVVLRPHPLISVKQHADLFKELCGEIPSYVLITKDLTAQDWLVASDACYTNYSSVALDAYFLRKPSFLMMPEPFPDFLVYDWFDGFQKIKTINELVDSILNLKKWRFSKSKVVENQFENSLDAIAESAESIAKIARSVERYPSIGFSKLIREIKKSPKQTLNVASIWIYFAFKTNLAKRRIPIGRENDFVDNWEFKRLLA